MTDKFENIYTEEFFRAKRDEFLSATDNAEQVQLTLLKKILSENSQTLYGKLYEFKNISSVKDFQNRVPLSTYENYSKFIKKISAGEKNVLTRDEVEILEPSSGSTSASKLIPYTDGLKKDFNKAIEPWLSDLYLNMPELKTLPAYWSITPSLQDEKYSGLRADGAGAAMPTRSPVYSEQPSRKIKIGFDNDVQYLSDEFAYLLQRTLFLPDWVSKIQDIEIFKYVTLLFLLSEEKLSLISIWNPSLFLILLEELKEQKEIFIKNIKNNIFPDEIEKSLKEKIKSALNFTKHRKSEVCEILSQDEIKFCDIWKNLKLISCWADVNAKPYAKKLQKLFPEVRVQPKGLLATEGVMTVPIENIGKLPCVNSHFFEFIEQNIQNSQIKLVHELSLNKEYSIVLTTSGGLYRYEIGDIVRVYDKRGDCPCLEFIGKKDNVSDYFGEKLNEIHVKSIIDKFNIEQLSTFYLFAPAKINDEFFYTLYIEPTKKSDKKEIADLEDDMEKELLKNFHYKYCRELNQIQKFKIFIIAEKISGMHKYLQICTENGIKLGDIKPAFFSNRCNWHFNGSFSDEKASIYQ